MANPLCEECKRAGKREPMSDVDHILSTTDFPELALVWDNLQSLCTACHHKKTGQDTAARAGKAVRHTDPDLMRMYESDLAITTAHQDKNFTVMN
jgi:5-methylcytosine-specific restriction endonuclease McrA